MCDPGHMDIVSIEKGKMHCVESARPLERKERPQCKFGPCLHARISIAPPYRPNSVCARVCCRNQEGKHWEKAKERAKRINYER